MGCAAKPEPKPEHYRIETDMGAIALDSPAAEILEALGPTLGYSERAACAFEGIEKTYRFKGICITTYPAEDGERIFSFWFTDGTYQTAEGIAIGDSAQAARTAYNLSGDALIVPNGEEKLTVLISGETVSSIQYSLF